MSLFVVCEGLDCAGKTTAMKEAVRYLEGYRYNKALKSNNPAGRFAAEHPSSLTLFLEILYLDRKIVRPALYEGTGVLQDRWYDSVLSYNPGNWKDRALEKIFVPHLSIADVLVYFDCALDERIRRLKEKAKAEPSHTYLIDNPQAIIEKEEQYIRRYNSFMGKKARIDTTVSSVEDTAQSLVSLISGH